MIASQLPAATVASGSAGASTASDASDAGTGPAAADGGFAGLLAPPSAAAPDSGAKAEAGTGITDTGDATEDALGDGSTGDPTLAERLLALIGMSAAPAAAARPVPGDAPPPSLATAHPHGGALSRGGLASPTGAPSTGAAAAGVALPGLAPDGSITGADAMGPAAVSPAPAPLPPVPTPTAPPTSAATPAAGALALAPTATAMAPQADAGGTASASAAADFAKLFGLRGTDPSRPVAGDAGIAGDAGLDGIGERGPLLGNTQAASAPRSAAPAMPAAAALAMPVDPDAGFDDSFGARIGWLADQRIGRAELRVSPDQFGTIDIRLQMDGNRISADFHASHADVRHALENSVGRLREMLGQQGLQLAHAGVGHGGGNGHDGQPAFSPSTDGSGVTEDGFGEMPAAAAAPIRNRGLLDEYA